MKIRFKYDHVLYKFNIIEQVQVVPDKQRYSSHKTIINNPRDNRSPIKVANWKTNYTFLIEQYTFHLRTINLFGRLCIELNYISSLETTRQRNYSTYVHKYLNVNRFQVQQSVNTNIIDRVSRKVILKPIHTRTPITVLNVSKYHVLLIKRHANSITCY